MRGFRHVGFKVASVDKVSPNLDSAGVLFRLRPLHIPELDVRIAFFFDPDGTVLEIVEGHAQYPRVFIPRESRTSERCRPPSASVRSRWSHGGKTQIDMGSRPLLQEGCPRAACLMQLPDGRKLAIDPDGLPLLCTEGGMPF